MFVLVYGERVEVPEGWIVVCSGDLKRGDQCCWKIGDRWEWSAIEAGELHESADSFNAVIRRDPGAEE